MATLTSNSAIATTVNLKCERADTFSRDVEFWEDEEWTIPIDVSDCTFELDVRLTTNASPVMTFTMGFGIDFVDVNIIRLYKSDTEMQVPAGVYKYDLQKITADGTVTTIMKGLFIIEQDQSR